MSHFLIRFGLLWLLFCSAAAPLSAQSFKAFEKAGDQAAEGKDYNAALQHYAQALAIRPDHAGLCYKYAGIAHRFQAFEAARTYYLKVSEHAEAKVFPLALYQLGMVEKSMGNYQQATRYFTDFIAQYGQADAVHRDLAADQIRQCEWAQEVIANPLRIETSRLNKNVNTGYTEFGPTPVGDTLYFSSLRFDNKKDYHNPRRMVSKILSTVRSGPGRPLRDGFNIDTRHTAHFAVSEVSRRVYFTRCDYVSASEIRCALYYRDIDRRGRWRGEDVRLPNIINAPDFTTTQPTIGYDSIGKAEILFFVSDRPGGQGGLDIWYCFALKDGAFSPARPLQALNTPGDDITPFFHTPTQTLYFSTNGRMGLGGFDIYSAKKGRNWDEPVHAGAPLNSSYNDIYPVLLPDGESGYFSSNRPGSLYLDEANKSCCNDIYFFQIMPPLPRPVPEDTAPETIAADRLPVQSTPGRPNQASQRDRVPETLEDFLPLALYFDNDEPDKRTRRTTTEQTYGATFSKYFRYKGEYVRQYAGPLTGEERDDAEERMRAFFDDDIRRGHDLLLRFSEILLTRLQAGDQVEVFIKGFTSPRAKSDYNLALGGRRVSSVRNHFDAWQNGVFRQYLRSGLLKITERSFGETTASSEVSDALDDLRGSIYSIGAMRERRVEIVEIKRIQN
ncbi:MAG: PD40 domain-containing protein [Saprospiraceae bacterium]|nr:PD40 domain-containing protein [Saprospiraceae bacterium]